MLGVTLLFVGIVLISNGTCGLMKVQGKAPAAINILVGLFLVVLNIVSLIKGDYYACGTGLLFAFTYLFIAGNIVFDLEKKAYGIYSLFVAINTIPCSIIAARADDWRFAIIWLAWGVLWFTGFLEGTLKKNLGKFSAVLAVLEGIATAWVPGYMMLAGWW
jgi:acid-activated urea channel